MSPGRRKPLTYVEVFAGIGGGREAARPLPMECVGAVERKAASRAVYWVNHGDHPHGDLLRLDPSDVEPMDILVTTPPCTPYSQIGKRTGLDHPAGPVVFGLVPLVARHMPRALIFESVPCFASHDGQKSIRAVSAAFERLGYHPLHESWRKLNSAAFGLATRRVRFFGVMLREDYDPSRLVWPNPSLPMVPVSTVLLPPDEVRDLTFRRQDYTPFVSKRPRDKYGLHKVGFFDRNYRDRFLYGVDGPAPTFCRSNSGLTGSAGLYLVDGVVRKLHPVEQLRAMGFRDDFVIPMPYATASSLIGDSICPPVLTEVYRMVIRVVSGWGTTP